tara:strand:+ start:64 stop:705 length:642 start_codon:yes stop_codon:yes gene_type:complete
MSILKLFPIPVYKGHLDIEQYLLDELDTLFKNIDTRDLKAREEMLEMKKEFLERGSWSAEAGLSTGQICTDLHSNNYRIRKLADEMHPKVCEYWEELGYAPANVQVTASWANDHQIGDYTGEHSHSDGWRQAHVASVIYLDKTKGRGNLEICNPLDYIHRLTPLHGEQGDAIMAEEIETVTGDFLLFPGWLRHRTQPTEHPRRVLSINWCGFL